MTITAAQAQTLLDTATDGIWTTDRDDPDDAFRILSIRKEGDLITRTLIADDVQTDVDAAMILSAPDLARTVIAHAEYIAKLENAVATAAAVLDPDAGTSWEADQ